jgi:hypothetical protein
MVLLLRIVVVRKLGIRKKTIGKITFANFEKITLHRLEWPMPGIKLVSCYTTAVVVIMVWQERKIQLLEISTRSFLLERAQAATTRKCCSMKQL